MRNEESLKDEMAGSTAVVVLTQGNKLWCGCHLLFTVGGVEKNHDSDHEYAIICEGAQMLGTRVAWRELVALQGEKKSCNWFSWSRTDRTMDFLGEESGICVLQAALI